MAERLANTKDAKPAEMAELAKTLVYGAPAKGGENGGDAADSEYLDEEWWSSTEPEAEA